MSVEDGGDGRFGPGDRLLFRGEALRGESTYFHPYSRFNVYQLEVGSGPPLLWDSLASLVEGPGTPSQVSVRHLEREELRIRFAPRRTKGPKAARQVPAEPQESWYWARLSHLDAQPFELTLDLSDRGPNKELPVSLRLELRGLSGRSAMHQARAERLRARGQDPGSVQRGALPDHQVDLEVDGVSMAQALWNGQEVAYIEIDALPESMLEDGKIDLRLKIPRRASSEAQDAASKIDVALL